MAIKLTTDQIRMLNERLPGTKKAAALAIGHARANVVSVLAGRRDPSDALLRALCDHCGIDVTIVLTPRC